MRPGPARRRRPAARRPQPRASDPSAGVPERLVELDPTRRGLDRELTDLEAVFGRDLRGTGEEGQRVGMHRSTVLQRRLPRTAFAQIAERTRWWPLGQVAATSGCGMAKTASRVAT